MEWLGRQPGSDGQVGTTGGSYCGSDQSALATLDPASLATMIMAVGAASYYHASMRQNGALEQRFIVYAFRMAVTSQEALADPGLRAALQDAYAQAGAWFARVPFKKGASALALLPTYEQWVMDILPTCRPMRLTSSESGNSIPSANAMCGKRPLPCAGRLRTQRRPRPGSRPRPFRVLRKVRSAAISGFAATLSRLCRRSRRYARAGLACPTGLSAPRRRPPRAGLKPFARIDYTGLIRMARAGIPL